MGLSEYNVVENGMKGTVQLSDEDAKLQGLTARDRVAKDAVKDAVEAVDEAKAATDADTKAKAPAANKAGPAPAANKGV